MYHALKLMVNWRLEKWSIHYIKIIRLEILIVVSVKVLILWRCSPNGKKILICRRKLPRSSLWKLMQTADSSNILVPIYPLVHSITSQKTTILKLQLFLPFFIVCGIFYKHDSMTFWKLALLSSWYKCSSMYW
jgi:hypothetical protein